MTNPSVHPVNAIEHLVHARRGFFALARYFLIALALATGVIALWKTAQSLMFPHVYHKDFLQEYLLGRAALSSIDPYLPVSDLAEQFFGTLPEPVFQHPTPHPPPMVLLGLPLALLSYESAAVVWAAISIVCIVISSR